jgi:hypothetical protein
MKIGKSGMSTATVNNKTRTAKSPNLDKQVTEAKAVLRRLRDTLEDLDDRRDLARAKKKNAGKSGTSWAAVKKELGLEF